MSLEELNVVMKDTPEVPMVEYVDEEPEAEIVTDESSNAVTENTGAEDEEINTSDIAEPQVSEPTQERQKAHQPLQEPHHHIHNLVLHVSQRNLSTKASHSSADCPKRSNHPKRQSNSLTALWK